MNASNDQEYPFYDSRELIDKHTDPSKLQEYLEYLLNINEDLNLVSRETSFESLLSLAADSLVPLEMGLRLSGRFFDIGPGGGFPSVPLLLAESELSALLIERTRKKGVFLQEAISKFGLAAEVDCEDFAVAAPSLDISSYDFGTMKYVRLDKKIIKGIEKILKPEGFFLYYSRLDRTQKELLGSFSIRSHHYYLDNPELIRTLNVISLGNS